jgi:hypothetical protein
MDGGQVTSLIASMAGLLAINICQFIVMIDCKVTEASADLRNTDPRLTDRNRIRATAAVTSIGACTTY